MRDANAPGESVGYSINLATLLAALLLMLAVAPLFEGFWFGMPLLYAMLSLVLLAGGGAASIRRKLFLAFVILVGLALPVAWISWYVDYPLLFVVSCGLDAVFCFLLAYLLLTHVWRHRTQSWQAVFGAISAYLLLGMAWAMLYWATERIETEQLTFATLPPGGGKQAASDPATAGAIAPFSQMVYFSFVTMTTLGYGDVAPQTPVVRTLAWLQAVVGQFYIAVVVARLVAEIQFERNTGDSSREQPAD